MKARIVSTWNFLMGIIKDRRLMLSLSFKDFKKKFAGSYFGTAWAFIQPLLTILIYWVVFQFAFNSGPVDDVPFILWFMAGIIPWLFISEAIQVASNTFLDYSYLVKKVVFNIDILPMVKILSSFYVHLFFLAFLFIMCLSFGQLPSLYLLQLPYYMFCTLTFIFAISLINAAVMIFFRDLNQLIGIILLAGMWVTPVAWNLSNFSLTTQTILKLNPFTYLVEGYRDCFVMQRWLWEKPALTLYFWAITIVLLVAGMFIYSRLKPYFSDTL